MKARGTASAAGTGGKPARPHGGAGAVRIVGGRWKRTPLPVPDMPGLRPTPARVRETLFDWLGHDLSGWRCIDVFAGTGALGLECASRGAARVLLCEQDAGLVAALLKIRLRLDAQAVEVRRADGLGALRAGAAAWDLVLLDPPFGSGLFEPALQAAAAALAPSGRVYLEAPEAWAQTRLDEAGWTCDRYLRAGAVHAHLLSRTVPAASA